MVKTFHILVAGNCGMGILPMIPRICRGSTIERDCEESPRGRYSLHPGLTPDFPGQDAYAIFWFCLLAATLVFVSSPLNATEKSIDFNRDIRPILSNKCFQCHGPDEEGLEAELRLDVRESAVGSTGSGDTANPVKSEGAAIIPGKPDASELIHRILEKDPDEVMPPPKTKKTISKREVALLKKWIEEGAEYAGHWAFEPVVRSDFPKLKNTAWAKNGIDHFILAKLEQEKLKPSPEANPRTLIRRLSIDLVGLLPAPKRVSSFVKEYEKAPDAAVKKLADELLSSPHYGERWGRHWLDQARYADSNGYTIDGERSMWPYRDWVIRALNEDMPFDQFTIEQLAGDLLEKPTKFQLIASGFHRNTLINQEGGTDDEQFRNEEVIDRVNTTGAVWLGLTVGCAQCHAHKFDPISQREFYELFAFFNQGTDVNNTGSTVEINEGELFLKNIAPDKLAALEAARTNFAKVNGAKASRQKAWEKMLLEKQSAAKKAAEPVEWIAAKLTEYTAEGGAPLKQLKDGSLLAGKGAAREIYRVKISLPKQKEGIAALRLRLIPDPSLPANGPGRAGNGNIVLTRVEFFRGGKAISVTRAQEDHAQPGFSATFTIDGRSDTGWAINIGKGSKPGVKMNAPHEAYYIFAKPIPPGDEPVEVVLRHELNDHYNIGRFALDVSTTAPPPSQTDREKLLSSLKIDPGKRDKATKTFLTTEFAKVDQPLAAARIQLERIRKHLKLGKSAKAMVMKDLAAKSKRKTFLFVRGDFLRQDKKLGALSPGVPAIFPQMAVKSESPNRLDLAKWLMQPDHPLSSRVTVNRIWMRFFGKGFVATENDFGTQGSYPTHPELLDWLAVRFREDGWSMKKLHRLIVTSATYRQMSHSRSDLVEIDPLNHLLARMNRIRFDAEIIRDSALSASGLLSQEIGGPGVTPEQPDGVYSFTQRKVAWTTATGADKFRRGMYIKFYRSAPYPLLTTFDSPDFQSVCTSRVRSNTPLQSLTQANDGAMFELAQGLATRLMREIPGADSVANRKRIRRGYALCFSRQPDEKEVELLAGYLDQQLAGFKTDLEAAKLVAAKDWSAKTNKIGKEHDVASAAAWTSLARALMNTDEFITRE